MANLDDIRNRKAMGSDHFRIETSASGFGRYSLSGYLPTLSCVLIIAAGLAGASRATARAAKIDRDYVDALAVADRFLFAWHRRDAKDATKLVSARVRRELPGDQLRDFLGGLSNPHLESFELTGGKRVSAMRYSFVVRSFETYSGDDSPHPLYPKMRIAVVKIAGNSWMVDEIPTPHRNVSAKSEGRVVRAEYDYALRTANNFLNAWQARTEDPNSFTVSKRVSNTWTEAKLDAYFKGSSSHNHEAYEIWDGAADGVGRYVFPVTLYETDTRGIPLTSKSRIVLLKSHSESDPKRASWESWTVDNLP